MFLRLLVVLGVFRASSSAFGKIKVHALFRVSGVVLHSRPSSGTKERETAFLLFPRFLVVLSLVLLLRVFGCPFLTLFLRSFASSSLPSLFLSSSALHVQCVLGASVRTTHLFPFSFTRKKMDLLFRSFWAFRHSHHGGAGGGLKKKESKDFSFSPVAQCQAIDPDTSNSSSSLILQSLKASSLSPPSSSSILSMGEGRDQEKKMNGRESWRERRSILKNVAAADYPTPQKYLDNPEKIPSYYVFQSNMVTDEDLQPGMLRNLEVDKRLTLPTRTHIRFLITATDVIHAWSIPALGIKADAIPGRLQRIQTFIQREGVFYGQCSELCGALHGFMPVVIEAVSPETYAAHAKKWYKD